MKKTIFNAKRAVMTLIAILTIGSAQVWALPVSLSYNYTALESMLSGGYEDANSYWKITSSANITVPILYQPTSNVTITFYMAYVGNGTEELEKISAAGSETSSTWILGETSPGTHPDGSTYANCSVTMTKPGSPTTLENLVITLDRKYGKNLRVQGLTVSYTSSETAAINVTRGGSSVTAIDFGTITEAGMDEWTFNLSATCNTITYSYYYYLVSIEDDASNIFTESDDDNAYGYLYSNPTTFKIGYVVADPGTYTATLKVEAYRTTDCGGAYNGAPYSINIPITITYDASCARPTVGATTVTRPASESTNTKLTFACPTGVTNTGGCDITEHGYVYSTTNTMPTIGGSNCTKFKRGDGISANTAYSTYGPTSLTCGTTYYVRAYAINAAGTSYSTAAASNSTHPCFVDHFIDDMHSTTGYTGTGMEKVGDYSASIPTIADKTERADGNCAERHYHFVGWVTEANKADPTGHIETITGTATGTTYYAVWAQESSH